MLQLFPFLSRGYCIVTLLAPAGLCDGDRYMANVTVSRHEQGGQVDKAESERQWMLAAAFRDYKWQTRTAAEGLVHPDLQAYLDAV